MSLTAASPKKPTDIKVAAAPAFSRELSSASTMSTASSASANSMFSATSSMSSATTVSSSSTSTFTSSHFKKQSKHFLIQETCTNVTLKGTFLHADCRRADGFVLHSSIDLDEIIGFVAGRLEWDHKHFSKACFEFALDGFSLAVKFRTHAGEQYSIARLDLRTRLRNANGTLIIIELNNKLSTMLSEVPWMKFKVIAEPDFSVFARHPVMQETLVRIAETTVEHVTVEMHKQLTIAMESAISVITASAMSHVQSQMESLVMDVAGQATASASITAAESLHLYGQGGYGFSGYAGGGYAAGGYAAGGYAAGGYSSNGYYASGMHAEAGVANGTNGHGAHIVSSSLQSPVPHGSVGRSQSNGYLAAAKHILHLDSAESTQ